ncbi:hypothetical protein JW711_06490 [Candidatus Woesearchaeota archaeon]|nr:hypothetical protein [Candidatus Woesearchaeota archaeon]
MEHLDSARKSQGKIAFWFYVTGSNLLFRRLEREPDAEIERPDLLRSTFKVSPDKNALSLQERVLLAVLRRAIQYSERKSYEFYTTGYDLIISEQNYYPEFGGAIPVSTNRIGYDYMEGALTPLLEGKINELYDVKRVRIS